MANTVTLLCVCLMVVSSIYPSHSNCQPEGITKSLCTPNNIKCCDDLTKSPNCATTRDELWENMLCSPNPFCGDNVKKNCCLAYYLKFEKYPSDGSCNEYKAPHQ